MTTYSTGNPVGSVDVKDLFDNAQNLDRLVNDRTVTEYPDRLGNARKSWWGMEQDFNAFLLNSQFEYPPLDYVDGTPLTVLRATQLIQRSGQLYRVRLPATFPVNLTGTWATDAPLLTATSDAALRQDLANPTPVDMGAALIARSSQKVTNIAALKTLLKTSASKFASTQGYYAAGDGGAADYYLDAADTTSADNGGSVIVAADGGRWKMVYERPSNAKKWGAKGDGSTDDTARIQALINWLSVTGGDIFFPAGIYMIGANGLSWTVSTLSLTGYRIGMHGEGRALSVLRSGTLALDTNATVKITADYVTAMNSLVFGVEFSNIGLETTGTVGSSFRHANQAYCKFDNVDFKGGRWAYFATSVLSTAYISCRFINASESGYRAQKGTGFSYPNALTFVGCQFADNGKWGAYVDNPGGLRVYGGSCENNGASDGVNGGGIVLDHAAGTSSGTSIPALLSGIYFEFNNGRADVYLAAANSFDNLTLDVIGCAFACGGSMITNDRVLIEHTVTSAVTALIEGCNFTELSGFTPTTSQKYIKVTGAGSGSKQITANANYYNAPNSFPDISAVRENPRANFRIQRRYSATTSAGGSVTITLDGFSATPTFAVSIIDGGTNVWAHKITAQSATSVTIQVYNQALAGGAWTAGGVVSLGVTASGV